MAVNTRLYMKKKKVYMMIFKDFKNQVGFIIEYILYFGKNVLFKLNVHLIVHNVLYSHLSVLSSLLV